MNYQFYELCGEELVPVPNTVFNGDCLTEEERETILVYFNHDCCKPCCEPTDAQSTEDFDAVIQALLEKGLVKYLEAMTALFMLGSEYEDIAASLYSKFRE